MASVVPIASRASANLTADRIVAAIEAVTPKLQQNALAEEKAGRLSQQTIEELDAIGVFRISLPLEYGGSALSTEDQRRVFAAVGAIAGSTGWVSWVTTTHGRWIAMYPKAAQDEIYGLPWVGPRISGVLSPHGPGRARRVDGGYMISGRWPFASGCRHTAWIVLGSMVAGPDGKLDMIAPVVRTADLTVLDDWAVSGMKGSGSNTVELTDELFVPEHRVMSMKDLSAGRWASEPPAGQVLFRNNFLDYTSILSGSTPLGMAKGALNYFRERMDGRGIMGTDYKVQAEAPIAHFQLAEATAKIEAAERLLSADCVELDRRAVAGEETDDLFQTKLKFDVALSVRQCCEAIETLHRASGASTVHEANPMQRYARDARVATVHAHFNYETCAENYGRALAGKPLFGNFNALEKKAAA